ncbi:aminopeptidase P family protein [Desnuesiella massiliensis]|uniref:aminopeptidase P family protein n=1 Tax=Desnuesiella massiliensis TaxID=1650662 RepID=UPI0006E4358F|nr:aminopeptidase P family protein [Desnuesiella massiliensis]
MKKKIYAENRKNLVERLKNNSILIMFAGSAPKKSADEAYPFTPNRNFYYLTGIDEEKIILMISKVNGKVEETLFIQKADPVMEKWVGKTISAEEAKEISAIEGIKHLEDFEATVHRLITTYDIERIYLDLERDRWSSANSISGEFANTIKNRYPQIKVKNIFNSICESRLIKNEEEIEEMKKAIDITKEGIESLMKNAKAGMKEYQLEAYFDFVLKTNGVKDYAFKTIAASGKNATVLHYVANNSDIKDGDLILFDLGAQLNYYNADISRTIPANGKFTERQKQIYNVVLKAELEVIKAIKPGLPFVELNNIAKKHLAEGLKELGVIEKDEELSRYYYHGVSHFLGLDTHDVGSREVELKPGMIVTVEPGLYIEEEAIGIRIEDDVLVTEESYEVLSKDIIKTVEEIEAFMNES